MDIECYGVVKSGKMKGTVVVGNLVVSSNDNYNKNTCKYWIVDNVNHKKGKLVINNSYEVIKSTISFSIYDDN